MLSLMHAHFLFFAAVAAQTASFPAMIARYVRSSRNYRDAAQHQSINQMFQPKITRACEFYEKTEIALQWGVFANIRSTCIASKNGSRKTPTPSDVPCAGKNGAFRSIDAAHHPRQLHVNLEEPRLQPFLKLAAVLLRVHDQVFKSALAQIPQRNAATPRPQPLRRIVLVESAVKLILPNIRHCTRAHLCR
jgi:hypothetical protein